MSTSTTDRPKTDDPEPPSPVPTPPRRLDLSVTQVVGGSLAAATAAALGSRLGVVGTISGAALVSVIASTASALYTASLRRTRDRVASALGTVRGDSVRRPARGHDRRAFSLLSVRQLLAGATAVFLLAAVTVTGVELLTGHSLEGTSGTTVGSTLTGTSSGQTPQPQRAVQPTATPSASATPTPTPSATATPSATPTAAPSATSSSSATPTPTATPSSTPTASATATDPPSATASSTPTQFTSDGVLPGPGEQ